MASEHGKVVRVHEDLAAVLDEEYNKVNQAFGRMNKSLSRIEFTEMYAKVLKSEQKELNIQPIKTGRRSKRVSLDIF